MVADTRNLQAITHAEFKNDRVDAHKLAELFAAGMLPSGAVTSRPEFRATKSPGSRGQIQAALIRQFEPPPASPCPIPEERKPLVS